MADVLANVHPDLIAKLQQVYAAMASLGYPMKPVSGVRTTAQQVLEYAKGRYGNPGKIVTDCDGIHQKSNHQVKADGVGHAVDSAFQGADPYLELLPNKDLIWAAFCACVEAVGLKSGKHFPTVDQPHAELP